MLVPELFNDSMFDDFFQDMGFPFYNDHDMRMAEKKLYGRRGKNLMKTDIKESWRWICLDLRKKRCRYY